MEFDSILNILLLEPDAPQRLPHHRDGPGAAWRWSDVDGLEAGTALPGIGCRLAVAGLYAGLPEAETPSRG